VSRIVLDASAVLAVIQAEPGHERLTPELLSDAVCSTVNLAEVHAKLVSRGLTPEEALAGVTCHAARALGMGSTHGTLETGKAADFALWDIGEPAELAYALGANPCAGVVKRGTPV